MPSRRAFATVAVSVALGLLVGAGGWGVWAWTALGRPHAGWDGSEAIVEIPQGASAARALAELERRGVIRDAGLVRLWLQIDGSAPSIQAGEYKFDHPASAFEVLDRLRRGDVLLHAVTVREGLDLEQTADRFVEAGFGTREGMLAAFLDPTPVREFDPGAPDLEGYLFPETYHFPRGTSPTTIANTMVDRFLTEVGSDYADRSSRAGLTVRQAVTLASMIERETSVAGERARISRVFHNRLDRSMKLQCDPTVLYALKREGHEPQRLTYRDLEFASPWNTYHAAGLPPGPIANPGKASLEAAVAPSDGDELYFVAAPDGGHRFSETLAAHEEAVREWRRYSRSSR